MITTTLRDHTEPQRWRNGGGVTRELLAWPDASNWSLRVSVADIESDGPFSAFPGVERWFAVIAGAGAVLATSDGRRTVTGDSEPLRFDGATEPHCRLLHGPTCDLNLMVRREAGGGLMLRASPGADWSHPAALRAVYSATPALLHVDDAPAASLPAHALAWSTAAAGQRWRLEADEPLCAWWLAFEPRR